LVGKKSSDNRDQIIYVTKNGWKMQFSFSIETDAVPKVISHEPLLWAAMAADKGRADGNPLAVIAPLITCSPKDREDLMQRYEKYLRLHPMPDGALMLSEFRNDDRSKH